MGLNLNKAIVAGNLTHDIELKKTPAGRSVVTFSVAVNRSKKQGDGSYERETDFIDCQAWEGRAEFLSRNFHKGDAVCVIGSIRKRQWKLQDGNIRYITEVIADEILFAGSKAAEGKPAGQAPKFAELPIGEDLPF